MHHLNRHLHYWKVSLKLWSLNWFGTNKNSSTKQTKISSSSTNLNIYSASTRIMHASPFNNHELVNPGGGASSEVWSVLSCEEVSSVQLQYQLPPHNQTPICIGCCYWTSILTANANLKLDCPSIGDQYLVKWMACGGVVYAGSGNFYTGLSPSEY
jgi:hypothetical protein